MDDDEEVFGKWSDDEKTKPKPVAAKPKARKKAPQTTESEDEELQLQITAIRSASKIYMQAGKKAKGAAYDRAAQEYYSLQFLQNEKQLTELQKKKNGK